MEMKSKDNKDSYFTILHLVMLNDCTLDNLSTKQLEKTFLQKFF